MLSLARAAWVQHAHVGNCNLGSEKTTGPGQTLAVAAVSQGWPPLALNRFFFPKKIFSQNIFATFTQIRYHILKFRNLCRIISKRRGISKASPNPPSQADRISGPFWTASQSPTPFISRKIKAKGKFLGSLLQPQAFLLMCALYLYSMKLELLKLSSW